MLSLTDIRLAGLITHYVGNGAAGDVLQLSGEPVEIDSEALRQMLLQYFLTPFKETASYNLWHPADIGLNEVASFVSKIFDDAGQNAPPPGAFLRNRPTLRGICTTSPPCRKSKAGSCT